MQNYTVYDAFANPNLQKKTWRTPCSIILAARSANCLRVAAKTRTKYRPATSRTAGEKGNMALA